jgi:hypothetical protein
MALTRLDHSTSSRTGAYTSRACALRCPSQQLSAGLSHGEGIRAENSDPAHHLAVLLLVAVLPWVAQEAQTEQTEHNRASGEEFRLLLGKILDITRNLFWSG